MILILKTVSRERGTPFEPLLSNLPIHPIEVWGIFIKPDVENVAQNYNTQNTLPVTQTEESKLSLDNTSHEDIPHLEQKLMSLPELIPEKLIKLQNMTHSAIT